jgi:hypothetical protein
VVQLEQRRRWRALYKWDHDKQPTKPEEGKNLPSLQRASNTSVQHSKSLSVIDVVAVRRRAAPAIGKSAVDSAGDSTRSGSRGQKNGLEAHGTVLATKDEV